MYNWSCLTPLFLSGASVVLIHDISSMYFEILFSISILVYVLVSCYSLYMFGHVDLKNQEVYDTYVIVLFAVLCIEWFSPYLLICIFLFSKGSLEVEFKNHQSA